MPFRAWKIGTRTSSSSFLYTVNWGVSTVINQRPIIIFNHALSSKSTKIGYLNELKRFKEFYKIRDYDSLLFRRVWRIWLVIPGMTSHSLWLLLAMTKLVITKQRFSHMALNGELTFFHKFYSSVLMCSCLITRF